MAKKNKEREEKINKLRKDMGMAPMTYKSLDSIARGGTAKFSVRLCFWFPLDSVVTAVMKC